MIKIGLARINANDAIVTFIARARRSDRDRGGGSALA
jgi:hypothetical protein